MIDIEELKKRVAELETEIIYLEEKQTDLYMKIKKLVQERDGMRMVIESREGELRAYADGST